MQFQKRRFIAFFTKNGKEQKEEIEHLTLKGAKVKFQRKHGFSPDRVERFGYGLTNHVIGKMLYFEDPVVKTTADKLFESY